MKLLLISSALLFGAGADFSADDKQQILDVHNSLRSLIAQGLYKPQAAFFPKARNMQKMAWSEDLEASAQRYANKCVFKHSGTNGVGENLYMVWGSDQMSIAGTGKDASYSWQQEFDDNGWPGAPAFNMDVFNLGIGHATQMAWANSNRIGCGATLCDGGTSVIVVCQYTQPGNYLDENAWSVGTTCTQCPAGTTCDSRMGLCA